MSISPFSHKYKGKQDYRKGLDNRYRNPQETPFKTSAKGEYSPEARAARHTKDPLMAEAYKIAHAEASAGGSAGTVKVLPRHIREAKKSGAVKRAYGKSNEWLDQRS